MGQDQMRDIETSRLRTSADRSFELQRGKNSLTLIGKKLKFPLVDWAEGK